jgi:hypothetical protein
MSSKGIRQLPEFNPSDFAVCAPAWEAYKRDFLIHLDAHGLDDKPGRRKVGVLLSSMGREAIRIYDSFEWAPGAPADEGNAIEEIEAEDKHNVEHVFIKFDRHFGVHNFRNIKRQELLNTKRGAMTIMDFISELKRKAEHCEYGDQREGFICDMIINGVNDAKCSERLMEIPAANLTLEKVTQTCRQIELTMAHLKSLESSEEDTKVHRAFTQTHSPQQYARGRGTSNFPRKSYQQGQGQSELAYCGRCCRNHAYNNCPAYNQQCNNCFEKGHFRMSNRCKLNQPSGQQYSPRGRGRGRGGRSYMYRGQRGHPQASVNYASRQEEDVPGEDEEYERQDGMNEMFEQCEMYDVFMLKTDKESDHEWTADLTVDGKQLAVEIDSGARCNVLSRMTAETFRSVAQIKPSDVIINGISGIPMKSHGKMTLPCHYKDVRHDIEFQVIDSERTLNLLGRIDSSRLGLITRVHSVQSEINSIIDSYSDVVGTEIGCMPGEYEIKIDESVTPVIHAPRPVPVAIRDQVKKELVHLEKCGIIKPVTEPTAWVNSMVCVRKKNGRVRICIDPSDLNKAIQREQFPMNSIDDIATRLHGSKYFSTLDANMGYFQIKLTERSSHLTTFNTPFGRYRYLRMPMGIKCASEVFQREMTHHFGGLEGVEVVVDDILVHGQTLGEHNTRLKSVLDKARAINLKLNKDKCDMAKPEVSYVGHTLTGEGLKPTKQRVKSIVNMKDPENHGELETILGMLAYVSKFIPNLSELNAPLREIKKQEDFTWDAQARMAFENVKKALTSTPVLQYFDVKKPVKVTVDASMKGLGAAILQEHGVVAYASRALSPTEQRYAQIEKEMLAVVFGCERFHKFLYGKSDVTIESDHKPLEAIMQKPIHAAPMRVQRMILKLQPYEFRLIYTKGKDIGLADCLSRLPLAEVGEKSIDEEMMILKIDCLSQLNHENIMDATRRDEELQAVKQMIWRGWPESRHDVPPQAVPYWDYRDELSTYNGVVYRGERTCIPAELRKNTLNVIHSSHMGIVKCKQRARELVYWPGMNKQIEEVISRCSTCLKHRNKPQKEPMVIQPLPSGPWKKVGADLCELYGNNYLIMVDYYSNFIEVEPLERDTTTRIIVRHMKANVARYGIIETLITDNGPQFTSAEFREFTKSYGIDHITSSPHHQQANGLAEKAVQTVKNLIKKCADTEGDIYLALLDLRNTPRDDVTGSPMQRLNNRRAKTKLPITENLLKPAVPSTDAVSSKLMEYRQQQKKYYDQGAKPRDEIKPSDAVRIYSDKQWKPAEFIRKTQYPRSYVVRAGDQGREYRRNSDMLLTTREEPHVIRPQRQSYHVPMLPLNDPPPRSRPRPPTEANEPEAPASVSPLAQPTRTRYGREIHRPKHFENFVCDGE